VIGKEVMYELKFYKNGRILVGDADQGLLKVQIVDDGERVFVLDRSGPKIHAVGKGKGTIQV
jgi:hypothetical protein